MATEAQEQLLDEVAALITAWQDRGTKVKDGVLALITILAETTANNGFPIDLAMHSLGEAHAKFMLHRIEREQKNPSKL